MKAVRQKIEKVNAILDEAKSYELYKEHLLSKHSELFSEYQLKKYSYAEFKKREEILLQGKTKKEWLDYYSSYIYSLLKETEELSNEIFFEVYQSKEHEHLHDLKKEEIFARVEKSAADSKDQNLGKTKEEKILIQKTVQDQKKDTKQNNSSNSSSSLPLVSQKTVIQQIAAHPIVQKPLQLLRVPIPPEGARKKSSSKYGAKSRQKSKVGIGATFGLSFIKALIKRSTKLSGKEERKTILDLKLRSKEDFIIDKQDKNALSSSAISEEARRIKNILEKRKTPALYQPSFFGALANVLIKRLSFFLLDTFPDFFKNLYNGLRMANIKILSNTYVNVMVLFSLLSFFVSLPIIFFMLFGKYFFGQVLIKTLVYSAIVGIGVFVCFYSYPFAKIKERRRNINSNLPFAINHMAAVASSGVAPTRMFQLIADSTEYGEVSIEVGKIVEYIELFGYDFLTALKSVSIISPSPMFKDFLEGLISTVESGGDIKEYLREKAEEAMLNYELERQKYTESISTYSDIYTGILIAAPLFFVTALAIVSMLGGAVGGIDVNVLTVLGTYLVVPVLNVAFLFFLEITQPEV